jgi:hypothetical protein
MQIILLFGILSAFLTWASSLFVDELYQADLQNPFYMSIRVESYGKRTRQ